MLQVSKFILLIFLLCSFYNCQKQRLVAAIDSKEVNELIDGLDRYSVDTFHIDSSMYFANRVDSILHLYDEIDSFKTKAYPLLINVFLMVREHKRAEVVAQEMLEFDNYDFAPSSQLKSISSSLYAHLISLDGKIEESKKLLLEAYRHSVKNYNSASYQLFLKNWMLLAARQNDEQGFSRFKAQLLEVIENADTLHQNLYRIMGEYHATKENGVNETIFWFKKAKSHLQIRPDFALRSTINYFLSEAYEKKGMYEEALKIYYDDLYPGQEFDEERLLNYRKNEVSYGYITLVQIAQSYLYKYQENRKIKDLDVAKLLILKCDSIMTEQEIILNENRDINMLHHSDRLLDVALQIFKELYNLNPANNRLSIMLGIINKNRSYFLKKESILRRLLKQQGYSEYLNAKETLAFGKNSRSMFSSLSVLDSMENELARKNYNEMMRAYIYSSVIDIDYIHDMLLELQASVLIFNQIDDSTIFRITLENCKSNISSYKIDRLEESNLEHLIKISENPKLIIDDKNENEIRKLLETVNNKKLFIMSDDLTDKINFTKILETFRPELDVINLLDFDSFKKMEAKIKTHHGKVAVFSFSDSESIRLKHEYSRMEIPFTIKEAYKIKEMKPDSVDIFSGRDASIDNFIRVAKDTSYSHLHLALHGYSSGTSTNELMLLFRNENYGIDTLYGFQIPSLIKKSKVVLSACDSNNGQYFPGAGKISLAKYFIMQGAECVETKYYSITDNFHSTPFAKFY